MAVGAGSNLETGTGGKIGLKFKSAGFEAGSGLEVRERSIIVADLGVGGKSAGVDCLEVDQ